MAALVLESSTTPASFCVYREETVEPAIAPTVRTRTCLTKIEEAAAPPATCSRASAPDHEARGARGRSMSRAMRKVRGALILVLGCAAAAAVLGGPFAPRLKPQSRRSPRRRQGRTPQARGEPRARPNEAQVWPGWTNYRLPFLFSFENGLRVLVGSPARRPATSSSPTLRSPASPFISMTGGSRPSRVSGRPIRRVSSVSPACSARGGSAKAVGVIRRAACSLGRLQRGRRAAANRPSRPRIPS